MNDDQPRVFLEDRSPTLATALLTHPQAEDVIRDKCGCEADLLTATEILELGKLLFQSSQTSSRSPIHYKRVSRARTTNTITLRLADFTTIIASWGKQSRKSTCKLMLDYKYSPLAAAIRIYSPQADSVARELFNDDITTLNIRDLKVVFNALYTPATKTRSQAIPEETKRCRARITAFLSNIRHDKESILAEGVSQFIEDICSIHVDKCYLTDYPIPVLSQLCEKVAGNPLLPAQVRARISEKIRDCTGEEAFLFLRDMLDLPTSGNRDFSVSTHEAAIRASQIVSKMRNGDLRSIKNVELQAFTDFWEANCHNPLVSVAMPLWLNINGQCECTSFCDFINAHRHVGIKSFARWLEAENLLDSFGEELTPNAIIDRLGKSARNLPGKRLRTNFITKAVELMHKFAQVHGLQLHGSNRPDMKPEP